MEILDVRTRLKGSIFGYDVEINETHSQPGVHGFVIGDQRRVEVG